MATLNNNSKEEPKRNNFAFAFGKVNYIVMIAGLAMLFLGYILLCGGGSDDPNVFNSAMFDTRRLFVAPVLVTLGLITEIVAIMIKPKDTNKTEE